ncbi:MAG: DUF2085 domain-containing protein [Anaerolineae bacterium]
MTSASSGEKKTAVRLNRFVLGLSRHWLRVVLFLLITYSTLPVIAPTLMKLGVTGVAKILYTMYSPMCHQFAFRSVFLFGEQPFYPRYNTGSPLKPFEAYAEQLPEFAPDRNLGVPWGIVGDIYAFTGGFQGAAREFVGNDQMGYKMTLCARDIGIYWALTVGAIIYSIPNVRRRLRPVPLWIYVLLGLMPIALDGMSQLLGYPPFNLWPPRETLPAFRVVTGVLFGLMNAWLGLPYLELSMRDTRDQIESKLMRAGLPV